MRRNDVTQFKDMRVSNDLSTVIFLVIRPEIKIRVFRITV